jgi:putative transposase
MFHVTWTTKYRKKKIYGKLRKHLGKKLRELAKQKECEVLERHLLDVGSCSYVDFDSTEICCCSGCWFMKGKSTITIARNFGGYQELYRAAFFGKRPIMYP